jgi:hypothetical protein
MAEARKGGGRKPVRKPETTGARAMARLLRLIGPEGRDCARNGEGSVTLVGTGAGAGAIDRALLARALSAGLVGLAGKRLVWTAATPSFLRRQLLEGEDAYADQHRTIEPASIRTGERQEAVRVNIAASVMGPLARLKNKDGSPWFPRDAVLAAQRFAADFHHAGLTPRVTMLWEIRPSGKTKGEAGQSQELADGVVAARLRVSRACASMGPELSGVVLDACCFEKGLELIERERRWPARSAKVMLRAGLMALHRHYHPPQPAAKSRPHVWRQDDNAPAGSAP